MLRIRALVNAELIAEKGKDEKVVQIGAGTYFEATNINTYEDLSTKEIFADITLVDGYTLYGVAWGSAYFENHGVPEQRITKTATVTYEENPEPKITITTSDDVPVPLLSFPEFNFDKLKEINEKFSEERNQSEEGTNGRTV